MVTDLQARIAQLEAERAENSQNGEDAEAAAEVARITVPRNEVIIIYWLKGVLSNLYRQVSTIALLLNPPPPPARQGALSSKL